MMFSLEISCDCEILNVKSAGRERLTALLKLVGLMISMRQFSDLLDILLDQLAGTPSESFFCSLLFAYLLPAAFGHWLSAVLCVSPMAVSYWNV